VNLRSENGPCGPTVRVGGSTRPACDGRQAGPCFFFFFFTLVTGPRRSLRLKLSDTRVYEPQIRARLGTTAHFCRVVALNLAGAFEVGRRPHRCMFEIPHSPPHQLYKSLSASNTSWVIQESMSLEYEPSSEPLHISVEWLF